MCNEHEENVDHVLVDCPYARKVFEGLSRWCNVNTKHFHTVKDVVESVSQRGVGSKQEQDSFDSLLWSLMEHLEIKERTSFQEEPYTTRQSQ